MKRHKSEFKAKGDPDLRELYGIMMLQSIFFYNRYANESL